MRSMRRIVTMDAGSTAPFPIRIPSAPGLGRVLVRLDTFAATGSGSTKESIMPIDSTNTVTATD